MTNHIIYISFGNPKIHVQNLFSILSTIPYYKSEEKTFSILIYTDNPAFFKKWLYPYDFINYHPINHDLLTQWKGPYNYIFRVKIKAIENSLENLKGKILYLDGDTFFINSPVKIFDKIGHGHTMMYLKEGAFSDPDFKNWECIRQHMKTHKFKTEKNLFEFPLEQFMWNAGVVGINHSNKQFIDLVLDLTDQYCAQVSLNAYHQDQVMFSYVLQNNTIIHSAEESIFHYCYGTRKAHMIKILNEFFKTHKNSDHKHLLQEIYKITITPVPNGQITKSLYDQVIIFFEKRSLGFSMAIERVKKSKNIMSFFDRGKKY
jgi:hypothetical protein